MHPRLPDIYTGKFSFYFILIFFAVLTFVCGEIPFFWDENYYILAAHHIFDSGFAQVIPPTEADRGNFPVYGFYMATWWKLFGKSLLVSHLAILPFLAGIAWEYFKLAKMFLSEKTILFSLVLLAIEPTFLTQSIYMGHDLLLVYFFLLTANALLAGKTTLYAISLCLLALHNIKGIPAAFSVILFSFFYKAMVEKRIAPRDWLVSVLPAFLWLGWLGYHQQATGWYLLTPAKDYGATVHFDLHGLKRILLGIWQVIDFGRVFLWGFILVCVFIYRKNIAVGPFGILLPLLFIPLLVFLIFFAVLDIDLCHRYYMPIFLVANIAACFFLELMQKKTWKNILSAAFCIGLITGNFWMYSGGFSNGWDSSLKSLSFFPLRDEMNGFIKDNVIDPAEVGTRFPLHHDLKYSDLAGENFHYMEMLDASPDQFNYVLVSNISNQFTLSEKEALNSKWIPVHEIKKGQVYLKLLKNPNHAQVQ